MRKLLINLSFLILVAVTSLASMGNASAAPWSQLVSWFNNSQPHEKIELNTPTIKTSEVQSFKPIEVAVNAEPASINDSQPVIKKAIELTSQKPATPPQWSIFSFPSVRIAQKNYDIDLSEYISSDTHRENLLFSFTPGRVNPDWVSLLPNGQLHIFPEKISPEDIDTTQVIYLSATNARSALSSDAEITIQIIPNTQLPAPEWQSNYSFKDGVPGKSYFINLANAIKISNLPDNDQLTFQIISSSASWLQIGGDGFSLIAQSVPQDAASKFYEVILRVTSKMSGKSNDLNGRIFINPIPQPLVWQRPPTAVINRNYSLDLTGLAQSNIRNDQIDFTVDLTTLPHWLSLKNQHILSGVPQEAALVGEPQQINVIATSQVTGISHKMTLSIPVNADTQLAPQWKKDFLTNPVVDENYRSDDLTTVLENHYPQDEFSFEYMEGPSWMNLNGFCHCLASVGQVPSDAAGKTFTVKLRVRSKASASAAYYSQSIKIYAGIPQWTQTKLPDVKIAQTTRIEIPINHYAQNDISGDQFTYQLDQRQSPRWIHLEADTSEQNNKGSLLVINPHEISSNEAGTVQSLRLIATSQNTHKISMQLLTVNVLPNPELPRPSWAHIPLAHATAGVAHVMDLNQFIKKGIANDRLTISLAADSPSWLSLNDNLLTAVAPRDEVGEVFPVVLKVHSQASDTDTLISFNMALQLVVTAGDNMETHEFYNNHQSIVIRGLKKNHSYHLVEVKGQNFNYGPLYSPIAIKTDEDWNNNPFYTVEDDKIIKTGDEGVVSLVYYSTPSHPAPQFESVTLR